jgi:3-dehydroquinate synthase
MNTQIKFIIDGKEFFADTNVLNADHFTVKSIPRPYSVEYDETPDLFARINQLLEKNSKNLLLIDQNILQIYPNKLNITDERIFRAEATEEFKTLEGITRVLNFLQKHEFSKGEQLIVVGGGIIQDIGAFVGAIYKRGIFWTHFPTTLLSMCDSCIGGKTGINYNNAKNQLALFSAPASVVINPIFLKTLDADAINSGLGEILKLCITGGEYFLDIYQKHVSQGKVNSPEDFRALMMAALCVKKAIVEEDEFELNHRRSLNYGHTLGHAIEVLSHYQIPHGQAVVIGMALVNELSHQYGLLSKQALKHLNQLCFDLLNERIMGLLAEITLDQMISLLQKDKKTEGQNTSFVFMQQAGDTRFVKLALNETLLSQIQTALTSVLDKA